MLKIPRISKQEKPQSSPLIAPLTLEKVIYQTGHSGNKPLKVIAKNIGISYWHLAHGIAARPLELSCRYLVDFMREGGPEPVLQFLAQKFEYSLIKLPQVVNSEEIEQMRENAGGALSMLFKSLTCNDLTNRREDVMKELTWVIAACCRLRAALKKERRQPKRKNEN